VNDVLNAVQELNRAWRENRFEELGHFFDPDVVMKCPGFKDLVHRREALVKSYADFMAQSRVIDYAESDHLTHVWGDAAAVTYHWTMTYEQKGQTKRELGQDMFVFARRDLQWTAILRLMLF
jgi:hypothetical protein